MSSDPSVELVLYFKPTYPYKEGKDEDYDNLYNELMEYLNLNEDDPYFHVPFCDYGVYLYRGNGEGPYYANEYDIFIPINLCTGRGDTFPFYKAVNMEREMSNWANELKLKNSFNIEIELCSIYF